MKTINDYQQGDVLLLTGRDKWKGQDRTTKLNATVTCVNYNGNGYVTYLTETGGQGAFKPADIGKHYYGFTVTVEKIGHTDSIPFSPFYLDPRSPEVRRSYMLS